MTRVLNGTQAARHILKYVLPLQTARFLAYHNFLAAHEADYRHVLLTDVRDVLFQDDPFLGFEGGLSVFEEDAGAPLVEETAHNARWIVELFGRKALARFGRLPILCSGTVMGTTQAVLRYLQAFERVLFQAKRIGSSGSDQGIHNYLCRFVIESSCHVATNGHGPIMTMGLIAGGGVDFAESSDGRILDSAGAVIPVLHQYDRHPELAARLLRRLASQSPASNSDNEAAA